MKCRPQMRKWSPPGLPMAEFEPQRNLLKAGQLRKQQAQKLLKNGPLLPFFTIARRFQMYLPFAICYLPVFQWIAAKTPRVSHLRNSRLLRSSMIPFTYAVRQGSVDAFLN